MKRVVAVLLVFGLLGVTPLFAKEKAKNTKNAYPQIRGRANYPELMVVPLASERLRLEANKETATAFGGYELYVASTAVTTVGSLYALIKADSANNDNKTITLVSTLVGGGFLSIGAYLGMGATNYRDAYEPVSKMPKKGRYNRLVRERMAEERIDNIATFNSRLRKFTGLAQVGLGIAMMATAKLSDDPKTAVVEDDNNSAAVYAGLGSVAAGLYTFLVAHPSEDVAEAQRLYKKKIYTFMSPMVLPGGAGLLAGIRF